MDFRNKNNCPYSLEKRLPLDDAKGSGCERRFYTLEPLKAVRISCDHDMETRQPQSFRTHGEHPKEKITQPF